ncbi:MAG: hypothetical protein H7240_11735 [Glaciimonas sp.]|nr:hypothetical protein [Glaciimonas sp.]
MAPLTLRCNAGRYVVTHKRLDLNYLVSKPQLVEKIEKGTFNLPIDTQGDETEYQSLPLWPAKIIPGQPDSKKSNGPCVMVENRAYVLELANLLQPNSTADHYFYVPFHSTD